MPFGIEHVKVICDALAGARTGKIGDGSLCLGGANLRGDLFGEPTTPRKGIRDFAESSLNGAFVIGNGNILTCLSHAEVALPRAPRSEEHTSELQSLMRSSYAVFCLKKKKNETADTRPEVSINIKNQQHT